VNDTPTPGILGRLKRVNRLFLFTVVIPTALAIVYFSFIASDQYISESRFVVRSQKAGGSSSILDSLTKSGGSGTGSGSFSLSGSQSDANTVHDFILSRDALAELEKTMEVKKVFARRGLDFINHFPNVFDWYQNSFEALFRYYPMRIKVEADSTTSVSVLTVSAFTAEDAQRINELLLKMSERLVNQLNDRARKDTIGYATAEVKEAERRARDAAVAVATYRDKQGVIDPEKQTAIHLQQIARLQEEMIYSKTQLAQLSKFTPDNPQVPVLRTRVEVLQKEIDAETAKVAGSGSSLANKQSEYERLALERSFAEKQLAASLAALETARNEAHRQQLYLERVSQPNLPDVSIEPRRARAIVTVFALGLIAWGILGLLVASVREHLD
jgi:capsular polysaccharide transport system permease protein